MKPALTPAQRIDRSIPESDLQNMVMECCARFGWLVHHAGDSRRSTAGLPDVIAVRDGRIVFAELKRETGRISQIQQKWLAELEKCDGIETYVWRPSNAEEIVRTFR